MLAYALAAFVHVALMNMAAIYLINTDEKKDERVIPPLVNLCVMNSLLTITWLTRSHEWALLMSIIYTCLIVYRYVSE